MKVQPTALAPFLLAVLLASGAHARNTPTVRSSSTKNRNSVCLELQRLGLSGPGCESAAVGGWMATPPRSPPVHLLTEPQLHRVCPVLCENLLGSDSCACDFIPAAVEGFSSSSDLDQVCSGFCAESVELDGCSCASAILLRPRVLRRDGVDSGHGENENSTNTPEGEVETTTEPDWASLCVDLCKVGQGGALCNCDKPPFF